MVPGENLTQKISLHCPFKSVWKLTIVLLQVQEERELLAREKAEKQAERERKEKEKEQKRMKRDQTK
jgi:hypothetical protein